MNGYGITDRLRFTVIAVNSNEIIARDITVVEPEIRVALSAPSHIAFKIPRGEQLSTSYGIDWKSWGQWIIPEIELNGTRKILGAQLVSKKTIDPKTGDLMIEGLGYMGYPKGIPWLEDYNPIAVDPAEVIQKIWAHLQSFENANLGVNVTPALTGTQMLPGYSFDGSILSFDFFAMFIRAIDFPDCGDIITSLARDIPLDMLENVTWEFDEGLGQTVINKEILLGYPQLGVQQQYLDFRVGENVITAELAEEREIEPVSDIIIRGWKPGKTYSSQLTNVDESDPPARVRRVIMEEDAYINSTERAAAWAKRKLTRRNIPPSFSKISIDPSHPNALMGSFWLGDSIFVQAENYPWVGNIAEWHRVTAISFKADEPLIEIELKVEGAFNFDPIDYDPNYEEQPTEDINLLTNGYFDTNLAGWRRVQGQWFRVSNVGRELAGSVRIDCDDFGEYFESHKISVNGGDSFDVSAWVMHQDVVVDTGSDPPNTGFGIAVREYYNGGLVNDWIWLDGDPYPVGTTGWTQLAGTHVVSAIGVNEITVGLCVTEIASGIAFWDDVRVVPS